MAAVAYDRQGRRLLLFGGTGDSGHAQYDVWQLSLGCTPDWSQVSVTGGPSGRNKAVAVFDPIRNQLVVHGGEPYPPLSGYPNAGSDSWLLTFSGGAPSWSQLDALSSFTCPADNAWTKPCPRSQHAAIYDPGLDRMVIFGGESCLEKQDTWQERLTPGGNTWTIHPGDDAHCDNYYYSNSLPSLRTNHSLIYDSRHGDAVVFGGDYGGEPVGASNAWKLHAGTWSQIYTNPAGQPDRVRHTAVYDSLRSRMIVFGGSGTDSTLVISLPDAGSPVGANLHPTGTPPPASTSDHVAIFDPDGDQMIVFANNGNTYALRFGAPPPAAVTDLGVQSLSGSSVWVRWTAPGDDGNCGQAASYDMRRSTSPITDANFGSATAVTGLPSPAMAGTVQSVLVNGLANGVVNYVAIETTDHDGNVSALSNVLVVCIVPGSPPRDCSPDGSRALPAPGEMSKGPVALAIREIRPNPAHRELAISFALSSGAPATVELIDVAGRRAWSQEVGAMGPGVHEVALSREQGLAPGYYLARLLQDGKAIMRPVVILN